MHSYQVWPYLLSSKQLGMSVLSVSDVTERSTETRCCYQLSKLMLRHKKKAQLNSVEIY